MTFRLLNMVPTDLTTTPYNKYKVFYSIENKESKSIEHTALISMLYSEFQKAEYKAFY